MCVSVFVFDGVWGEGRGVNSSLKTLHDKIQFLADQVSQVQKIPDSVTLHNSLSQLNVTLSTCKIRVYRVHRRDVGVIYTVT